MKPVPVLTGPGLYGYGYGYPSHHITSPHVHLPLDLPHDHLPHNHFPPLLHHYQRPHSHVMTTPHDITKAPHVYDDRHDNATQRNKGRGSDVGMDGPSCPSLLIGTMFSNLKIVVLTITQRLQVQRCGQEGSPLLVTSNNADSCQHNSDTLPCTKHKTEGCISC